MTLPNLDPREAARKTRALTAGVIGVIAGAGSAWLSGSRFHSWAWTSWVAAFALIIALVMPVLRVRFSGRDRLGGHDAAEDCASITTHGRSALVIMSRLMPRSSGARWLAEAESTLSEISDTRRGPAFRSYLLSAPRLLPMMWAREIARLGRRRPG
jgi:hypothetical protein